MLNSVICGILSDVFNYSTYLKHWNVTSMIQDYGYFGNIKLLLKLNLED